jgi:hypothetical protein
VRSTATIERATLHRLVRGGCDVSPGRLNAILAGNLWDRAGTSVRVWAVWLEEGPDTVLVPKRAPRGSQGAPRPRRPVGSRPGFR